MKINGTTIAPEEGKVLIRKSDNYVIRGAVTLGYTHYIKGKRLDEKHMEVPEDYDEVAETELDGRVEIGGMYWPVEKREYNYLKDFLIKLKYTIEDQIAIICNYELDPQNATYKARYDEMQQWRELAGQAAKDATGKEE